LRALTRIFKVSRNMIATWLKQKPKVVRYEKKGRTEEPSAGLIDSQSVKGTAESAEQSGADGWKKVKGRKHPIVIDTAGCVLAVAVHAANQHDIQGAYPLLKKTFNIVPTLRRIWADQAYQGDWVEGVKVNRPGN